MGPHLETCDHNPLEDAPAQEDRPTKWEFRWATKNYNTHHPRRPSMPQERPDALSSEAANNLHSMIATAAICGRKSVWRERAAEPGRIESGSREYLSRAHCVDAKRAPSGLNAAAMVDLGSGCSVQ